MTRSRRDPYIDALDYEDTGCELRPACLSCDLPLCRYDQPRRLMTGLSDRIERDTRIFELVKSGMPRVDIKRAFGVSYRQIQRIVQRAGASERALKLQDEESFVDEPPTLSPLNLPQRIKARKPWPRLR